MLTVQLLVLNLYQLGTQEKEGDWYTYAIWDLTEFNKRYGTKYYARAYKRFDESTDTTVELIDKTTGNVVETRTVTSIKWRSKNSLLPQLRLIVN